jgi:hypothetical protein
MRDARREEGVMFGVVLIVAIEAVVLLAIWQWDKGARGAELRQRRQKLLEMRGRHSDAPPAVPPSALANTAG